MVLIYVLVKLGVMYIDKQIVAKHLISFNVISLIKLALHKAQIACYLFQTCTQISGIHKALIHYEIKAYQTDLSVLAVCYC